MSHTDDPPLWAKIGCVTVLLGGVALLIAGGVGFLAFLVGLFIRIIRAVAF